MSGPVPPCRVVAVSAFRGDRTRASATSFLKAMDDGKNRRGPGPTDLQCLLFAGHSGLSMDGDTIIYGFNPDRGRVPAWQLMDRLKNGDAFPGVIRDDTAVFSAARAGGLSLVRFEVILPGPRFQEFGRRLDGEQKKSQYSYGFPNGDGDCNCTTWMERLGLPLLTGRMDEFVRLPGVISSPSRRFGKCV